MCPARYSGSGPHIEHDHLAAREPLLELRGVTLLDLGPLAEVVVGQDAHLGDVPGGDIAHRGPEVADAIARKPVDDPACRLAARAHQAARAST